MKILEKLKSKEENIFILKKIFKANSELPELRTSLKDQLLKKDKNLH